MLPSEGVERDDADPLGALAESVEACSRVAVCQGGGEVELRERGVGGLEVRAENPPLIGAAQVDRPGVVRLVLENVAADECERFLERAASLAGRFLRRTLEQLVEPVQVERDQFGREPVRLGLGDDERACALSVGIEVAAKVGDERLQ